MDSLNFNSVETLPTLSARAAFQVNSSAVFKEYGHENEASNGVNVGRRRNALMFSGF